jgi:hypothetical protein
MLILAATQMDFPECVWSFISENVPRTLGKKFKTELETFQEESCPSMCEAVGLAFCRFVKSKTKKYVSKDKKLKNEQDVE